MTIPTFATFEDAAATAYAAVMLDNKFITSHEISTTALAQTLHDFAVALEALGLIAVDWKPNHS